jgi:NAD(P)H-nitrite reductase large subunit
MILEKNNINLVQVVTTVETTQKEIVLENNTKVSFDKLVLATGSKPNKYGWPGQDLQGVTGLYHKQDLEALEKWASTRRAVIVGGGLIGIELAEMLRSRDIAVTFLVRENFEWCIPFGESQMINRHILEHHIDLKLDTNLVEIISDEGHVKAILTDKGAIECRWFNSRCFSQYRFFKRIGN